MCVGGKRNGTQISSYQWLGTERGAGQSQTGLSEFWARVKMFYILIMVVVMWLYAFVGLRELDSKMTNFTVCKLYLNFFNVKGKTQKPETYSDPQSAGTLLREAAGSLAPCPRGSQLIPGVSVTPEILKGCAMVCLRSHKQQLADDEGLRRDTIRHKARQGEFSLPVFLFFNLFLLYFFHYHLSPLYPPLLPAVTTLLSMSTCSFFLFYSSWLCCLFFRALIFLLLSFPIYQFTPSWKESSRVYDKWGKRKHLLWSVKIY